MWGRLATILATAFVALILLGGAAQAEQGAIRQLEQECLAPLRITTAWTFYSSGGEAKRVANRAAAGDFLLGCEDEIPAPAINTTPTLSGNPPFGGGAPADTATNSTPDVLSLAVLGDLDSSERLILQNRYGFASDWWTTLENREQGYLISWVEADPATPALGRKVLIVGGDRRGLTYGVVDFVKSLIQVDFASGGSWRPVDWQTGSTCTDYAATTCTTPGSAA